MKLILAVSAICLTAYAQSNVAQAVPALPMNVQILAVPASRAGIYLGVTVNASVNGGDFIDVRSPNTQVLISLILPNGTEVNPANASTFSFTVLQVNSPGTTLTSGVFTPFDSHTTFILPAGSPGGVYQVKANSTSVPTTKSMNAIDSEESDTVAPGTVIEIYRSGYEWDGEVFRPAQVKVSRPPSGALNE